MACMYALPINAEAIMVKRYRSYWQEKAEVVLHKGKNV